MSFNLPLYQVSADLFKGIAHPVRIRILELLREKEMNVSELQPLLGLELPNISQQLAVLRASGIVSGRKQGSLVFYSVKNTKVFQLLDVAVELFEDNLLESAELLRSIKQARTAALAGVKTRGGSELKKTSPRRAKG